MTHLRLDDPEVYRIVEAEKERIENTIDLIAAENHAPLSILEAQGSVFNLKAAEGYPGRRFHAGCGRADDLENLAVERGKKLFGADHINVQPHSGTSANLAVYFAVLNPATASLPCGCRTAVTCLTATPLRSPASVFSSPITASILIRNNSIMTRSQKQAAAFKPADDRGRCERLRAADRLPSPGRYRRVSRLSAGRHGPHRRTGGSRRDSSPVPVSDFVTFTTYKTMMGGRGGVIICKENHRRQIDRAVFPGSQGTPALNQVAAKAVCFTWPPPANCGGPEADRRQRRRHGRRSSGKRGYRLVSGGTDNHSASGGSATQRIDRPGRRRSARINRYHRQPQCDPQRSAAARSGQWHPGRCLGHQCQGT